MKRAFPVHFPSFLQGISPAHPITQSLDTQFWANIYSNKITSDECLSEVRSLLSCPSKIVVVRNFLGDEAQTFIDFLDQVSKLCAPVPQKTKTFNAGSCPAIHRGRTSPPGLAAHFQDLQSPQDHTCLIYSSTGARTSREHLLPRRVRIRV